VSLLHAHRQALGVGRCFAGAMRLEGNAGRWSRRNTYNAASL
jgi:hypothetical protein